MALKIYKLNESTLQFSEVSEGTFVDPVVVGVTPGGSGITRKLYLRNDDNLVWYNDIVLTVKSSTGASIVDGSVSIKLLSGDSRPSEDDWSAALANDNAQLQSPIAGGPVNERLPEIGDAIIADLKYYPFWLRTEMAKASPIGSANFRLDVSFTENVI